MEQLTLGNVSITRVREYYGSVGMEPHTFFPDSSQEVWKDGVHWLAPHFLDSATGSVNSAIQTWLLRSGGKTVLVDTGVGNHKERPYAPVWGHLRTNFLDNLARAGVRPEDVDIVINTHLHVDHVGWNTYLDGRQWVPTFPNATYLMPKDDFDFWNPENNRTSVFGRGNQNVFEDSVAPVHRAGQALLWENGYRIDGDLRLEPAPGHTPGSSVLILDSGTDRAVFVGDLLHNPVQIVEPDANSCFCEDPAGARATRRKVLGWAADNNALVVPAHLGGHGAAEIVRRGTTFDIKGWAPFTPYAEQS
ncbi:MBL fold metallo-hydrolase [Streptomyces calvus]|uniref:Glyoxylase-like metal-dependent hydrolase (Beta-lactamase superfamily II) n=1 Tax=Streptomyces calvus TaxID=67282 RepID=A0AA40VH03_9ACTN|nr:MBL fold metallo-hydrolase [Streptomyces calvus]MBA8944238.1 glyoxylase-like metal-dependent hydrolase (beta-lactamase superfamily II) [Streptomyces calvus]GGP54182.1 MBL fold metallo-hydrolase [Streptomyces calvus]